MIFLPCVAWAVEAPADTLDRAAFTAAVLAANPEAAAARAALAAARAGADAAGRWGDLMVEVGTMPLAIPTMPGWEVEVSQQIPLWGIRRAERAMATAGAEGAEADLRMTRLMLAEMATMAWADWYVLHREIALVETSTALLRQHAEATLAKYAVGRAWQHDALQAQAEAAGLVAFVRTLEAERDVTQARMNTLLHRDPDSPVAPPPASLARAEAPAGDVVRPELAEAEAMRRMAEAELRMARADRLPMVEWMAGWDAMAAHPEERLMVGVGVEVPLSQRSRAARVRAAEAEVSRAASMEEVARDEVARDVAEAERRLAGARAVLDVVERELLPAARDRVEAARAAFAAGMDDVRPLLDAERAVLDAEIRHEEALAALELRAAMLRLARGEPE
ncbi:MAG: TolC family protein [Myxococcota bacterium]